LLLDNWSESTLARIALRIKIIDRQLTPHNSLYVHVGPAICTPSWSYHTSTRDQRAIPVV
jgi:hypothetical protein